MIRGEGTKGGQFYRERLQVKTEEPENEKEPED